MRRTLLAWTTLAALAAAAGCGRVEPHVGVVPDTHSPIPAPPVQKTARPAPVPDQAEPVLERGLTAGEVDLVRPIFGASVDYTTVRVIRDFFSPFHPADAYLTPQGSIYAPGELFFEDFAASNVDPYYQAIFVHEMVHVWQYQSGFDPIVESIKELSRVRGDYYDKAYWYSLDADQDLLDYGLEQEASIIEDWFLLRTFGLGPFRFENPPGDHERDRLYGKVLAAFHKDPSYARALAVD